MAYHDVTTPSPARPPYDGPSVESTTTSTTTTPAPYSTTTTTPAPDVDCCTPFISYRSPGDEAKTAWNKTSPNDFVFIDSFMKIMPEGYQAGDWYWNSDGQFGDNWIAEANRRGLRITDDGRILQGDAPSNRNVGQGQYPPADFSYTDKPSPQPGWVVKYRGKCYRIKDEIGPALVREEPHVPPTELLYGWEECKCCDSTIPGGGYRFPAAGAPEEGKVGGGAPLTDSKEQESKEPMTDRGVVGEASTPEGCCAPVTYWWVCPPEKLIISRRTVGVGNEPSVVERQWTEIWANNWIASLAAIEKFPNVTDQELERNFFSFTLHQFKTIVKNLDLKGKVIAWCVKKEYVQDLLGQEYKQGIVPNVEEMDSDSFHSPDYECKCYRVKPGKEEDVKKWFFIPPIAPAKYVNDSPAGSDMWEECTCCPEWRHNIEFRQMKVYMSPRGGPGVAQDVFLTKAWWTPDRTGIPLADWDRIRSGNPLGVYTIPYERGSPSTLTTKYWCPSRPKADPIPVGPGRRFPPFYPPGQRRTFTDPQEEQRQKELKALTDQLRMRRELGLNPDGSKPR